MHKQDNGAAIVTLENIVTMSAIAVAETFSRK